MNHETLDRAPSQDELEISVFGRGMGESILCHLGQGRWMMVDSFRDQNGRPVGDAYLDQLAGEHRVVAVIATHWDDDHTHGLSEVIARHEPQEVWMPVVLNSREVFRFAAEHNAEMADRAPSGLRDFVAVLAETRGKGTRRWGIVGREVATGTETLVSLLAPTDEVMDQGLEALGISMDPGFGEVTSISSNRTSIVVWVEQEGGCALLGADLEKGTSGWSAVIARQASREGRAGLIKVPHHGSDDADEPLIWTKLAAPAPINCLTRYTRLKRPLPRQEDIDRLVQRSGNVHIAGALPVRTTPETDPYDLQLEAVTRHAVRPDQGLVGIIRARLAVGTHWTIESFGHVETVTA